MHYFRSPGKIISINIPTFEALTQFGTATVTAKNTGQLEASYSLTVNSFSNCLGVKYLDLKSFYLLFLSILVMISPFQFDCTSGVSYMEVLFSIKRTFQYRNWNWIIISQFVLNFTGAIFYNETWRGCHPTFLSLSNNWSSNKVSMFRSNILTDLWIKKYVEYCLMMIFLMVASYFKGFRLCWGWSGWVPVHYNGYCSG